MSRIKFPPPPLDFRFLDLLVLVSLGLASVAILFSSPTRPLEISNGTLARGIKGVPYEQPLVARGGSEPYRWSTTGLPQGLQLNEHGLVQGSPDLAGHFQVFTTVIDNEGLRAEERLALDVLEIGAVEAPRITTVELLPAPAGTYYSLTLAGEGGLLPYRWVAESLPAGLSIENGVIKGVALEEGVTTVKILLTDASERKTFKDFTLRVLPSPEFQAQYGGALRVTSRLPKAISGSDYNVQLAAAGGVPPYQWKSLSADGGLSLSSVGLLATEAMPPSVEGINVRVFDSNGAYADSRLSLTVLRPTDLWLKVLLAVGVTLSFFILILLVKAWLAHGPRFLRLRLMDLGALVSLGFAALAVAVHNGGPMSSLVFIGFCSVFGVVALRSHA